MTSPSRSAPPARLAAALVPAACLALPGCSYWLDHRPGGGQRSDDEYTYISTPHMPLTVSVLDMRNNEIIWTADVPIGDKLTMRFYADQGEGDIDRPDVMRWAVYPKTTGRGYLANAIPMPAADARFIQLDIRDGIAYAEERDPVVSSPVPSFEYEPTPVPAPDQLDRPMFIDDGDAAPARDGSFLGSDGG